MFRSLNPIPASAAGGDAQIGFGSIDGVVISFTSITAIIVVNSIANLPVALQQRAYALWQLVGMRVPRALAAE